MGVIKQEDIRGYYIDGSLVCSDCITDEERNRDFALTDLVTADDVDGDDYYFCDRCNKTL